MTPTLLLVALLAPVVAGGSPDEAPRPSEEPADALPDPLAAGWRGAKVCERLHEEAALRVLRCTFPPGAGHERHFHPPHFGYALSGGRMRLTDARGTREVELAAGSSFASDGVAWHEVLNVGETTVSYLIIEPLGGGSAATPGAGIGMPAADETPRSSAADRSPEANPPQPLRVPDGASAAARGSALR